MIKSNFDLKEIKNNLQRFRDSQCVMPSTGDLVLTCLQAEEFVKGIIYAEDSSNFYIQWCSNEKKRHPNKIDKGFFRTGIFVKL
jgi:hypothetical protein